MLTVGTALRRLVLCLVAVASALLLPVTLAQASHSQLALFEDDGGILSDPGGALQTQRLLGVGEVRINVEWSAIAPSAYSFTKPNFDAANPNAAGYNWATLDKAVRASLADHITPDFLVTGGIPFWATGPGIPAEAKNIHFAWEPSAAEYGKFFHAVVARYGRYVHTWEIWNEPNFGEDLGPQAIDGSRTSVAPGMYRGLLNAAWSALGAAGHGQDTIVIGQLAARGLQGGVSAAHPEGLPGNFGQTKPLQFIRSLYCVNRHYQRLAGAAAGAVGCPVTSSASRAFPAQNPALFKASGFGIHPYPVNLAPTRDSSKDPDFAAFSGIPRLERALDSVQHAYSSQRKLAIYNNEYGYVTRPPARGHFVSPSTASLFINQAEYLSWKDPRIASYMQYLLHDPSANGPSQFFSGLIDPFGKPKPTYDAFRMPLFLPVSAGRRRHALEVWGCVRPVHGFGSGTPAQIQFSQHGAGPWKTVSTVRVRDLHGYFDTPVAFPGSGFVRVAWRYPAGSMIASRSASVTVR